MICINRIVGISRLSPPRKADTKLATITRETFEVRKADPKGDGIAGRWMSPLELHVLPRLGPIRATIFERSVESHRRPASFATLNGTLPFVVERQPSLASAKAPDSVKDSATKNLMQIDARVLARVSRKPDVLAPGAQPSGG